MRIIIHSPDTDMRIHHDQIFLSPSDLGNYLACSYLTLLEAEVARSHRSKPHPREDLAKLVAEKGDLHEAAYLAKLLQEGRRVTEVGLNGRDFDGAAAATEAAMRSGAEVIYQAVFSKNSWRGVADFLIRVDELSDL